MKLGEAMGRLLLAALVIIGAGWLLGQMGFADWGAITSIGGVLLFAFIAIVVGVLSDSLTLAVASGSAITGLLMLYVYIPFAVVMFAIFGLDVLIWIAIARANSQVNY